MKTPHQIEQISAFLEPQGRIYADILTPAFGTYRRTHVMVHGGMHSGMCWIRTPDGRPGWARHLAARGDRAICLDWPGMGRSGYVAPNEMTGETISQGIAEAMTTLDGELVLWTHSMSGPFGWRIAELLGNRLAALVAVAPGPPGNLQPVAEILDRTEDVLVVGLFGRPWTLPLRSGFAPEHPFVTFKFIEGSAHFPVEVYDTYFNSLQSIPVSLLEERLNVDGRQLRITDYRRLAETEILVVTAENDPDHTFDIDDEIVGHFKQNGLSAEMLYLPDKGIGGGGHMMMIETNSDAVLNEIARRL